MSETTITAQAPAGAELDELIQTPASKPKKTLDPGAKRNLIIVGSVTAVAIAAVAAIALTGHSSVKEQGLPKTTINQGIAMGANEASGQLTPDEIKRLDRVNTQKADEAAKQGVTFIPSEVPMNPTGQMPIVTPPPPGTNYSVITGAQTGGGAGGYDQERLQRIQQGFQTQLGKIAQANLAPPTSSAPRYVVAREESGDKPAPAANAGPAVNNSGKSQPSAVVPALVEGLHLAAGELISPIDTDKTSFASAKIASGPLSGATLYGIVQMVADQGVRVRFNRMLFNGRSYSVNAIALDPSVSHDTLSADIDRKLLERYVLPLIGTTASAYLQAVGQAGQTAVLNSGGTPVIIQPELSAKQAAAQGVASGINQVMNEYSRNRANPSASLPAGSPIGVLFLDPVQQPNSNPAPVANWEPTRTNAISAAIAAPGGF